ncbi:hypothetical protein [Streptomyces sp. Da 82-17]|uniref:hypothetical protein n=1 Tax=Streptomyces sp. Da 82-17 TaxID=3377116 RepID=UPI0038D3FA8B
MGPGWRHLVLACHEAVVAEFPAYQLCAVKQKWGVLSFQAFPRAWRLGVEWTNAESARLDALIDVHVARSERTCERCGAEGSLREERWVHLVLCKACDEVVGENGQL